MAERMAHFCLATGLSPSDYRALTMTETQAFWTALEAQSEVAE